jgi:hypothetical protein
MTDKKKCEFCDKRGLPLLLVRDAVATVGGGAPKAPDLVASLGSEAAYYTKRLLRSGYVYVYDEARKRLECYFITTEGFYFKVLQTEGTAPVVPAKPFNCPDEGDRAVASCITISDPVHATIVWVGFSDVLWTDAVQKNHERDAALRSSHMRRIDVQSRLHGGPLGDASPITDVDKVVAEYTMEPTQGRGAFDWSPFAFDARKDRAQRLKDECHRLRPGKGFILTLADPAGVAQELAALMTRNAGLYLDNPKFKRELAVSSVILQIENAVKSQAEIDEIAAAEQLANEQVANNPLGHWLSKSTRDRTEELRNVTPAESDLAGRNAWRAYTDKYNEPARKTWQDNFDAGFKKFDAGFIAPLATAHAAWMKSDPMAAMAVSNFDPDSIDSGIALTALVNRMVAGTQDKKACFDLYGTWLEGSAMDRRNLLLRAMVCDQNSLAKTVNDAAKQSVDINGLPWDKVVEAHAKATERLVGGETDELGKLIASVAGPVTRLLLDAAKSRKVYESFVAMGMAAQHPVVAVDLVGGKKAFRQALIRQMLKLSGAPIEQRKIEKAVADEFKRLKVNGMSMEGTQSKRFLLMIDPAEVKGMPAGSKAQAQAQWLARTIRTPEQIDELNLDKWRLKVKGVGKAGLPFAFGALGLLTQYAALTSLREEESKAMQNNKSESLRRIYAQGAQVAGVVADILGQGVGRLAPLAPRLAQGMMAGLSKWLIVGGKFLGIGGSLVMAGFDVWRAGQEYSEGNMSGFGAYLVSGALGMAATVLLAFGWTGWGLVVVAALIVWSFIMTSLIDNKIQDWLERVYEWGDLDEKRYPTFEVEQSELRKALAN